MLPVCSSSLPVDVHPLSVSSVIINLSPLPYLPLLSRHSPSPLPKCLPPPILSVSSEDQVVKVASQWNTVFQPSTSHVNISNKSINNTWDVINTLHKHPRGTYRLGLMLTDRVGDKDMMERLW